MQYSVHSPPEFIRTNLGQLLPSWSLPVLSVLVVLQLCQIPLFDRTVETELSKNQLRQQFIEFGDNIVLKLRTMGHLADIFDPRTGQPLSSPPGQLRLSDVKVVHSTLGYCINDTGPCSMVVHPIWGTSVYPSTLVSSAPPQVMDDVVGSLVSNVDHNLLDQELAFIPPGSLNFQALFPPASRWLGAAQYTTSLLRAGAM